MPNLTDIVNTKADFEDVGKIATGSLTFLGYWGDLTGVVTAGQSATYSSETWVATESIVDVTLSEPSDSNDSWYKGQTAVFDFVVSQLAGGVSSIVGYIFKDQPISSYEWMIWPATGQVFDVNGATGTFSNPLDFDPSTGIDSGITGTLVEYSVSEAIALGSEGKLDAAGVKSVTGTATFTKLTNNINLANVGLNREKGDVINLVGSASATASTTPYFTIEEITDVDNIIVNKAHANGTTGKSLLDETLTNFTVSLVCKWYVAAPTVGLTWVDMTSTVISNIEHTNNTGRELMTTLYGTSGTVIGLTIDGVPMPESAASANAYAVLDFTVPINSTYELTGGTITRLLQLR